MNDMAKPGLFCISTYEKGQAFLREAARLGAVVTLLTVDKLWNADWPREALSEVLTMPEGLTPQQVMNTVLYMARTRRVDRSWRWMSSTWRTRRCCGSRCGCRGWGCRRRRSSGTSWRCGSGEGGGDRGAGV